MTNSMHRCINRNVQVSKMKCETGFGLISQLKLRKKMHPDKPILKVYLEKYQGKKQNKTMSRICTYLFDNVGVEMVHNVVIEPIHEEITRNVVCRELL